MNSGRKREVIQMDHEQIEVQEENGYIVLMQDGVEIATITADTRLILTTAFNAWPRREKSPYCARLFNSDGVELAFKYVPEFFVREYLS